MKEHLIDTQQLLLVPVKVIGKGQGQITRSHSQKMANSGALMFHKHILFSFCAVFLPVQRQVLSFEQYLTLPNDKWLFMTQKKPFENVAGKGENCGYQHFLSPTNFSAFSKTIILNP